MSRPHDVRGRIIKKACVRARVQLITSRSGRLRAWRTPRGKKLARGRTRRGDGGGE